MIEWECTLDCNYKCDYCTNGRNSVLKNPIKCITDKTKIFNFLKSIKTRFPDEELFLFGGEPFLHPEIEFIIKTLNSINLNFVIQSNFSCYERISKIEDNFKLQVSLHKSQIRNLDEYIKNLIDFQSKIQRIDLMFEDKGTLNIYKKLKQYIPEEKLLIAPIADFNVEKTHLKQLKLFNILKKALKMNFEEGERSFLWEKMMEGKIITKGHKCLYKNKYHLFDPQFNEYNCSYRVKTDICPNENCFLM